MAIDPNFSASQQSGDITVATFTDTSTGSEPTLTGRLISLRKYDGTYLMPEGESGNYVAWPIGDASVEIDVLDKDYALEVTVLWFTGSTITHTETKIILFRAYSELFLRQLTQALAANRMLLTNKNYWSNKIKLRTLVDDAIQGVALLNDQTIATFCLDEAKKITDNPSLFY